LVNFPTSTPRLMAFWMESGNPSISVSISDVVRGPPFSSWAIRAGIGSAAANLLTEAGSTG
jgi:hypothetical protein